jgi:hypothetical protein
MRLTTLQNLEKPIDYNTQSVFDLEWDELAQVLLYRRNVKNREDAGLFNLIAFKDINDPTVQLGRKYIYKNGVRTERYFEIENTVRRCKENALEYHGLLLDYDGHKTINEVKELLDGLEYVIYTTFRHTPQKERFRVVLPFSNPISTADFEARKLDISDTFEGIDPASLNTSQCFYFHSGAHPYTHWNKGVMINPYDFKVIEKPIYHIVTDVESKYDLQYYDELCSMLVQNTNLRGVYHTWLGIYWALCSEIGENNAISLMMKHWPDKTDREKKSLKTYQPRDRTYKYGTLIYSLREEQKRKLWQGWLARTNPTYFAILQQQEAINVRLKQLKEKS